MKGSIFMDHHILMKNVWKKFGEITALRDANLMVKRNTIHAIVGENSAGKSTLVRILAGIERMDKGEIWISGRKVKIRSARDSLKLGIGMVHQHLALIEDFTVAENLFAVGMDDPLNIVTKRRLRQNATKIMERFQMNLNPDSKVSSLSLGEKQKVEILRVLKDEPKIIILDEPTSLLNDMEAEDILRMLKSLKMEGKTVIFISHRLDEVMKVADEITVMRNGRTIGPFDKSRMSEEELFRLMFGEERTEFEVKYDESKTGEKILEIKNLRYDQKGRVLLEDVNFTLRRGEILGILGFSESGVDLFMEILFGLRIPSGGRIIFKGEDITFKDIMDRRELGIGFVPADRRRVGSCLDCSIWENVVVNVRKSPKISGCFFLNTNKIMEYTTKVLRICGIATMDPDLPAKSLSGGSLQRLIIAREILGDPDLLIFQEPSWGLDMLSLQLLKDEMLRMKNEGKSVIVSSKDYDEFVDVVDRFLIFHKGKISSEFLNDGRIDKARIVEAMVGKVEKMRG